jgi:hypothetical protein
VAGFFSIDRELFARITGLGLKSALAYLVLAAGTGREQRVTAWSVNAVRNYAGLGRKRAEGAVGALLDGGFLTRERGGRHPRYRLLPGEGAVAWLPNTLVTGAADEPTPLERIRPTGDAKVLRLLVDLYGENALPDDGGVCREYLWYPTKRARLAEIGSFLLWGFRPEKPLVYPSAPFARAQTDGGSVTPFFERLETLLVTGLASWAFYVLDEPEGEPILPLEADTEEERQVGEVAQWAGEQLESHLNAPGVESEAGGYNWWVPLPRHIRDPAVVGVLRLRYRPHTSMTARWWASTQEMATWKDFLTREVGGVIGKGAISRPVQ